MAVLFRTERLTIRKFSFDFLEDYYRELTDEVTKYQFPDSFKATPHNSKCAGCARLASQVIELFRQTKQKFAGVAGPTSRIFVTYDGKLASRCVLKA